MMRVIEGELYRLTFGETGLTKVIECENEQEMIEYVAQKSTRYVISNVTRLEVHADRVSTPKVAVKSSPYYKALMREYLKGK